MTIKYSGVCRFLIISLLVFGDISFSLAQEKKTLQDYISVGGYVKYMNTSSFSSLDSLTTDNLIHNRINLKGYISEKFVAVCEIRNRLFYGQGTGLNPYLGEMLDEDLGEMDLSFVPVDHNNVVFHTILDRAYLKYTTNKWELRMGRQRINWGVNLAWNPNDLFNAYNLIDFDYQERPGADAVRLQYFTGELSSIDMACQPGEDIDKSIVAVMWKFNKWAYDFQLLGGNYYTDAAAGAGWAGNIKNIGFKGEGTYFHPKEKLDDTTGVLSSSVTLDYSFRNGLYVNTSVLYNSDGQLNTLISGNPFQAFSGTLSAKNLMPSEFTYFVQGSGLLNPALSVSLSVFYVQDLDVLFGMPSVAYSIQDNWEVSLVGQTIFAEVQQNITGVITGMYLRLMFSY